MKLGRWQSAPRRNDCTNVGLEHWPSQWHEKNPAESEQADGIATTNSTATTDDCCAGLSGGKP